MKKNIKIKRAKLKQELVEQRLKTLFKEFPIPSYLWQYKKNDFILVDYNYAADSITQGTIKKFMGKKFSEMYEMSEVIKTDFLRCYHEKITVKREMSCQFQGTGSVKDLIVYYIFVSPNFVLVHTEDVTSLKHIEKELKKISQAVEQTADSIVITDKQGIIEYVNPAFEETTGFSREEVLGQTMRKLKSGKQDKAFYNNLWDTILKGEPFRGTIINKKKSGELYWSQQSITAMKDDHGNINHFVSVLKDITELRAKQEHEFHLNLAREVQQQLKANISVPGFDIAGVTYPAVETSGDYFDFFPMADGTIALIIGDVCGHGIGSALIMAETRAFLRAFSKTESDPGVLLTWLNRELVADLSDNNYVTLIMARLNPQQNLLDYASAGHLPFFHLNKNGEVENKMESTGIPLGIIHDYRYYKSASIKLTQQDIIVFHTDGISEAHALDESQFGHNRMLEIIKCHRQANARQIVKHIYRGVCSFSKRTHHEDDITSIILKVDPAR